MEISKSKKHESIDEYYKELREQVFESFREYELNFRKNYPSVWWSSILGPVVLTAVILGLLAVFQGPDFAYKIVGAATVTFFFLSRFVILGGEFLQGHKELEELSSTTLFMMVTYMDVIMAVVVTFHIGLMFRIPWLGPKIGHLVADGHFILDMNPWMRKASFIGLILFVIAPFAATGCVGGAIFGRLLGMSRGLTLAGLVVGSIMGNGIMLLFAKQIAPFLKGNNPILQYGGIVLIVVLVFLIERFYSRSKKKFAKKWLEQQQLQNGPSS